MIGEMLASTFTDTDQSTTATTPVALAAGTDHVSFTLDVAADVLVEFLASGYNEDISGGNLGMAVMVDLVERASGVQTPPNDFQPMTVGIRWKGNLAAGQHQVEIWFNTTSGNRAHWLNRLLRVTRAS